MKHRFAWLASSLMIVTLFGCRAPQADSDHAQSQSQTQTRAQSLAEWREWQAKRQESLAGTNGWLALIARHWLPEGRTFAGSHVTNQLVLPHPPAAPNVGAFVRSGNQVRYEPAPDIAASIDGNPVRAPVALQSDANNNPTRLQIGRLTFVVIERGERLGLRVRDPNSPARLRFPGIKHFPYNPTWRVEGRFETFAAPKTLRVPDVTGGTQEFASPGAIVFRCDAVEHRLEVVVEPGIEDYFVIFRDRTAGRSTYGSGRFLYVAQPDAMGRVVIDFNRAYTPPCGFTPFAVCPLPPPQNWLPIEIRAGERAPAGHP